MDHVQERLVPELCHHISLCTVAVIRLSLPEQFEQFHVIWILKRWQFFVFLMSNRLLFNFKAFLKISIIWQTGDKKLIGIMYNLKDIFHPNLNLL